MKIFAQNWENNHSVVKMVRYCSPAKYIKLKIQIGHFTRKYSYVCLPIIMNNQIQEVQVTSIKEKHVNYQFPERVDICQQFSWCYVQKLLGHTTGKVVATNASFSVIPFIRAHNNPFS